MSWLLRLFRMEPIDPEEPEESAPPPQQGGMLRWRVVKNRRPSVWAITPRKLEDAVRAADRLIEGSVVFVNLQHIDSSKAQRIVDMLAGVSYALRGNFYEIGKRLFLFVPPNVSASGDEETIKAVSALFTGLGDGAEGNFELPVR